MITETLNNLLHQTAFFNLDWGNYVMIAVACFFLYLAIKHEFEPLLLVPIAFGMLLVNIYPDIMAEPYTDVQGLEHAGGLFYYFFTLDEWSILPSLIFMGVGAMTDFGPLIANPITTSLFIETKEHYHRAELVERIWEAFEHYYEIFLQTEDLSGLVNEYNSHLVNMHQQVKVLDPKEPFEGKAMGITPKGELIVDTWESRKLVSTGEVSVRGIYGYV